MSYTLFSKKRGYFFIFALLFIICMFAAFCFVKIRYANAAACGEIEKKNDFIKYVEFKVPELALERALKYDIESHENDLDVKINWIEILACLATKKHGEFTCYKNKDVDNIVDNFKKGMSFEDQSKNSKLYKYYDKAYTAVLKEFVGAYTEKTDEGEVERYGLKVFSPIAKTFPFNHYDDFGASRSYGYSRPHLGHDLMAAVGTPVIAIEGGVVEAMGWNQYGGWRIGIRSFDKQRYYYYAHLRKDKPYHIDMCENKVVQAGDVIGYVGRTGYSSRENVNNISQSHLHVGMELIFDESQKESDNEIWIDMYAITKFLQKNQATVYRNAENKNYYHQCSYGQKLK